MKDAMFDRPPSDRLPKETVHEASRDPQAGDRRRQGGVQHGDRVSPREGAAPASSQQACQGTAATRSSPEHLRQRYRPHADGGARPQHRSDSVAAACRNLDDDARADLTTRYDALCAHYGMEPTRNNTGIAHENGSIESSHGHLKKTVEDGVLMRGSRDFVDLAAYRRFIDELSGRHNAKFGARIDIERVTLQELPGRRTVDFEEAIVTVTSSSGFVLRKVFYSTPSRLIGHRLRVRLYDDRLDVYLGATLHITMPRGRARPNGAHGHVIDYPHLIHSLRRKPMTLMVLVYRVKLFPRQAYRRPFEVLVATVSARAACLTIDDLLALAHDRACEGELAERLTQDLEADILPAKPILTSAFTPNAHALPTIVVTYMPLSAYDELATISVGQAA